MMINNSNYEIKVPLFPKTLTILMNCLSPEYLQKIQRYLKNILSYMSISRI